MPAVSAGILAVDAARLERALARIGGEFGTERADICAARLVEMWTWLVAEPTAGAVLSGQPVPNTSPATTRLTLDGPSSAWVADFEGRLATCEEGALVHLRGSLIAQLTPLIETLNGLSGRPRRALWRGATDRIAGAFLWAGEQHGTPGRARVLARRAVASPPLRGRARTRLIVLPGGTTERIQVRDGCCLYYRVPGGERCSACPLLDDEERGERLAAELPA
ncbi:MAG TPA: (2Fe-2S)-binding protein [Solirubrobacterales bacterium]|nr:(2Fe-2S)-binding protein [Solirubrobacterales bacterium]